MKRSRIGSLVLGLSMCLPLASCDKTLLQRYAAAEKSTLDIIEPEFIKLMSGELGPADFPEGKVGDRVALLQSRRIAIEAALR